MSAAAAFTKPLPLPQAAWRRRLEVFSPMGERIATRKLNGEKKAVVSLENRVAGIYFIRVSDGSRTATAKIVLQP